VADTVGTLMRALLQKPNVAAVMDGVFKDVLLYGAVRPETDARLVAAIKAEIEVKKEASHG
jgi:hypothetical protein